MYPKVRLVTLWLGESHCSRSHCHLRMNIDKAGTNDSALPTPQERKAVPVEQFEQNIRRILDLLTSSESPYAVAHGDHPLSIILITPPAIQEGLPTDHDAEHTIKYRDAVLRVGEDLMQTQDGKTWKLGVIDLYNALSEAGKCGDPGRFYT